MRNQFEKIKKLNNKGLSMVELLLSIMILMIVSTSLFSFMIMGGRMFNRSNAEVDMQSEAQIMKNYMNDLITDTAKGLEYATEEEAQKETYGAERCLIIYGEKVISYLAWVEESKQVHYLEKKNFSINADGSYNVNFSTEEMNAANWPVLAQCVSKFECQATQLKEEHRIFSAEMEFTSGKSNYATTHTITLRNNIFFEGMANGNGSVGGFYAHITGITLTPGFTDKSKGSSVRCTHAVSAVGDIDKSVTYTVEGGNSANTRMDGEVLHIGADETSSMLTVICKSNIDENISATAIVNVTNVSSIAIVPENEPNYKDIYYYPGSIIDFSAKVEGNFISPDGRAVTWEIKDSENAAIILESTPNTCRIKLGPKMKHDIILKAVSKADPKVSREYSIRSADVDIGELYISAVGGQYTVKRDGSLQLQLLVSGQPADNQKTVTWSILDNPLGAKVSINNTGKMTASKDVPYANTYELTVQAEVTDHAAGNTVKTVTCRVKIEPVQITFDSQYAVVVSRAASGNNVSTNPTRVKIMVKGLNMENNELRIQQNPYVRGLEHWMVDNQGDYAILALNMTQEKPQTAYAILRVSLKDDSSVYSELQAYFMKYNHIYGGKYVYIPLPGDVLNLVEDTDNNGIPKTTKTVTVDDNIYGYVNVSVNGVIYHYYVDQDNVIPNVEWYVTIDNELKKYVYNNTSKMYEEYISP